jgi:hypothetical protein
MGVELLERFCYTRIYFQSILSVLYSFRYKATILGADYIGGDLFLFKAIFSPARKLVAIQPEKPDFAFAIKSLVAGVRPGQKKYTKTIL